MRKLALRLMVVGSMLGFIGPAVAQIAVTDPWVRATVEGQTATGAYLTLSSARDVALLGATSDVAGRASIHEMRMNGDTMMMRPVERLPILAGRPLALDEGHYHVMLEDLKRRLNVGDRVGLDLTFADSNGSRQTVHVVAPVRELTAHGPPRKAPVGEHE